MISYVARVQNSEGLIENAMRRQILAIFHFTIGATLFECYKEIERGQAGTFP